MAESSSTETQPAPAEAPEPRVVSGTNLPIPTEDRKPALLRPIASPENVIQAHKEAVALIEHALERGTDYGSIPGVEKETLLKPGAERLCTAYNVVPTYIIVEKEIDHHQAIEFSLKKWETVEPDPGYQESQRLKNENPGKYRSKKFGEKWVLQECHEDLGESFGVYRYVIKCQLIGRHNGILVGEGIGSCSTLESKYIRQPRDYENTVLKMAEKRALVAAVLNAFGLSDRFTQDVEDEAGYPAKEGNSGKAPAAKKSAPASKAAAPRAAAPAKAEEPTKPEIDPEVAAFRDWLKGLGVQPEDFDELKALCAQAGVNDKAWLKERYAAKDVTTAGQLKDLAQKLVVNAVFREDEEGPSGKAA